MSVFDISQTVVDGLTSPKLMGKVRLSGAVTSTKVWTTKFIIANPDPTKSVCYVTAWPQRDIIKIEVDSDYKIKQNRISVGNSTTGKTNEVNGIGINKNYMLVPIINKQLIYKISLNSFTGTQTQVSFDFGFTGKIMNLVNFSDDNQLDS